MIIGILQTGKPPSRLQPAFGGYSEMFEAMVGPGHDYRIFDVEGGELPEAVDACPAYLVTGSSAGVYDDLPWIAPLEGFLREAKGRVKLVGVCFGHQVMAQAFGGRAEKSAKGWGVGLQTYEVRQAEPWMDSTAPIAVAVSHQDQVTAVPPGARVLGGNAFCPNGLIDYGAGAISMQCHPEFSPDFAKALLEARRARPDLAEQAEAAIASLDGPNDRVRVAGWIQRFLSGQACLLA